jgi:release factor glutamine methyltransferase
MTLNNFLAASVGRLTEAGISTARLDVLVLLEDALQQDRAHLLAHPEIELTNEQLHTLGEQISKRALHVPLAYIRGKTEFYGREFSVNDYVLEPRPESETMIDLLKNLSRIDHMTIVDVGTGSGALAITAKLELPTIEVSAIDIDPHCLELTRKNAVKHNVSIAIIKGDLVRPLADEQPETYTLLCNLPYVPDSFQVNLAATHEPRLAIFGGPDGLDLYRKLFDQIEALKTKPQYILTEAMPPQHEELAEIASRAGYTARTAEDFIQVFTV